ncbi:MAG: site-specific DNA-methyltransferase [Winogradskyella sp.]|uniref:site-specific DNA-methyltransferase n=1 Tax=Winogradskyella sp. TaxID=1883156 RepID=UPI0017EF9790|nr:site-specific DNA-methyltransferase [Winogradskyella sp.]MBT8244461.1 site-specific DNA-methyltransferase [Winogradskyella sp.]NNK23104.1 site-specific DNA-methyltransferase [Winogradskyella sp.]
MSNDKQHPENPMEKVQSHDWNKERLKQLKQLMPDLFTNDGKLNISELKKVIDPKSVNETERYEFRWFGKSNAKREAFTPTDATLVYDEDRSVNPTESENLIIEGENLAVLKLLSNSYREQVKCIYIDPPYNTGKDFVYSDKFNQDKAAYWEDAEMTENGYKIDTNTETDGRFHSNWLNMMYSRLLIARQLLREDGVIFISIDDNEVHHLRKLCDDVFGEDNFISNVIWEKKFAPSNDAKWFSDNHDHIIVYAKNKEIFRPNLLERTKESISRYKNPDNDERGVWVSGDMTVKTYNQNYDFEITTPSGKKISPPKGICWRYSKEKVTELINDNRIWFGTSGDNVPRVKRFLTEVKDGITPLTIWYHKDVGHNQSATQELRKIFLGEQYFDTPKPTRLLERIIHLSMDSDDLILDFFAGSGTTGQAITELNQEDGGNRKYILVQLPEQTDEKSEAYKAGYKKISDITIERNKRVIERIEKKLTEKEEKKKGELPLEMVAENTVEYSKKTGLGFKVFKLQKSNFPRVEFAPDPEKTEQENIDLLKKYIKEKEAQLVSAFNKDELITEILIKNGFKLNYTLTKQEKFKKNEILFATDGDKETLICLDVIIANETVEHFKTNTNQKLIVLERALDTTKKWNLKHAMGDKFNAF